MGLFSGVKKAVSSVTKSVGGLFNSAKDIASSPLGGMGLEALGSFFGVPGAGTAISKFLGGGSLTDLFGSGIDIASAYAQNKQSQEQAQKQFDTLQANALEGIRMQNATAREIANQADWVSQANAREQMDFQAAMSNTAHQREMGDLQRAGLNPILSGTGGMGASTPAGAAGSAHMAPVADESKAITTAMEAFKGFANALQSKAQTSQIKATTDFIKGPQTESTKQDIRVKDTQWDLNVSNAALTRARTALTRNQIAEVQQNVKNLETLNHNYKAQGLLTLEQRKQVKATIENLKQTFRTLKVEGDINETDAHYWNQVLGRSAEMGEGAVNAIKALKSLFKK